MERSLQFLQCLAGLASQHVGCRKLLFKVNVTHTPTVHQTSFAFMQSDLRIRRSYCQWGVTRLISSCR